MIPDGNNVECQVSSATRAFSWRRFQTLRLFYGCCFSFGKDLLVKLRFPFKTWAFVFKHWATSSLHFQWTQLQGLSQEPKCDRDLLVSVGQLKLCRAPTAHTKSTYCSVTRKHIFVHARTRTQTRQTCIDCPPPPNEMQLGQNYQFTLEVNNGSEEMITSELSLLIPIVYHT